MRDKKIILNKCVLNSEDVATFEYETKLKVFASVPPVDDRQSRIEPIIKFISKANLFPSNFFFNSFIVFTSQSKI